MGRPMNLLDDARLVMPGEDFIAHTQCCVLDYGSGNSRVPYSIYNALLLETAIGQRPYTV
jgi:hypothetical protein